MHKENTFFGRIEDFYPGYFTLAMATTIIAIALHLLKLESIAEFSFWTANFFYATLLLINLARLLIFFSKVKEDLLSHKKGSGFLSFVAASFVLGIGYIQLTNQFLPAMVLLGIGTAGWVVILYSFLLGTTLRTNKPSLGEGMNGSWLLIVVSTQSMAILNCLLTGRLPLDHRLSISISILIWLLGILFYIIFVTLMIYRLNFFPVKAEAISPSFWLDAGAAAATALAGVTILNKAKEIGAFIQFQPLIELIVLLFWAAATWWLVLLFLQEGWRHYKIGLHYMPGHWSLVFPLGMYAVASLQLAGAGVLHYLTAFGNFFTYVAILFWIAVFVGMLFQLYPKAGETKT